MKRTFWYAVVRTHTILAAFLSASALYPAPLPLLTAGVMQHLKGTVIAEVSFAVDHAAFGSRITIFAHPRALSLVARKQIDIDGDVLVDCSRLRHHFRCTSAINIAERSLTARASERQPSRRRAAERHLVA